MFGIQERREKKGVTIEDMVAAALLLYVPHGLSADEAEGRIRVMITKHLDDPNISSLLLGAVLLEEELFFGRKPELAGDPVFLLANEIIGMAIAECIGGTYARFEFTRYDQKKPGILSRLGPFLDDHPQGKALGLLTGGRLETLGATDTSRMELKDNFGQTTLLRFSNLERNPALRASLFRFTPPKGADVISD